MPYFKINFSSQNIRKVALPESIHSFEKFTNFLKETYPMYLPESFEIQYEDEDGDVITVSCELEWTEMFHEKDYAEIYIKEGAMVDMGDIRTVDIEVTSPFDVQGTIPGDGVPVCPFSGGRGPWCTRSRQSGCRSGNWMWMLFIIPVLCLGGPCLIKSIFLGIAIATILYRFPKIRSNLEVKISDLKVWFNGYTESLRLMEEERTLERERVRVAEEEEKARVVTKKEFEVEEHQVRLAGMGIYVSVRELTQLLEKHNNDITEAIHDLTQ